MVGWAMLSSYRQALRTQLPRVLGSTGQVSQAGELTDTQGHVLLCRVVKTTCQSTATLGL